MASSVYILFSMLALTLIITVISLNVESDQESWFTYEPIENQVRPQVNSTQLAFVDGPNRMHLALTWDNCASSKQIIIHDMKFMPDPVKIPGDLWFAFNADLLHNLTKIDMKTQVFKKVFGFWVKMPCEDGMGSCSYADLCAAWPIPSPCPQAYIDNHIPCACPFPKGSYHMPLSKLFYLQKGIVPQWLENGSYKIIIQIDNLDPFDTIMCITMLVNVQAV